MATEQLKYLLANTESARFFNKIAKAKKKHWNIFAPLKLKYHYLVADNWWFCNSGPHDGLWKIERIFSSQESNRFMFIQGVFISEMFGTIDKNIKNQFCHCILKCILYVSIILDNLTVFNKVPQLRIDTLDNPFWE